MEDLAKFIYYTKESGYYFPRLGINGPGEPLLWKNFNAGVQLLKKSQIASRIHIDSNGLLLDIIEEQTWECIDNIRISVYEPFKVHESLREAQERYKDKILIEIKKTFRAMPRRKYKRTIPCSCLCFGPMFIKDKIFLFCGSPVFEAAALMKVDIFEREDLCSPIGLNYMDRFDPRKIGNLEFCEYCWANSNINMPNLSHCVFGD
jgi:hypothetical protein